MTTLKTIGLWLCYPLVFALLIVTAPLWIVAIFVFAKQMDQMHQNLPSNPEIDYRARRAAKLIP